MPLRPKPDFVEMICRAVASSYGVAVRCDTPQIAERAREEIKRHMKMICPEMISAEERDSLVVVRSLDDASEIWICKQKTGASESE